MSSNSVSFFGFSNPIRQRMIGSSDDLTEDTRSELESLSVDTTDISTESQGQQILKEAKATQQKEDAQKPLGQRGARSEELIKNDVKYMANQLGIPISGSDSTQVIINNIFDTLNLLKTDSRKNKALEAQIIQVETQLEALSDEYEKMSKGKTKLTGTMDALARYNKVSF